MRFGLFWLSKASYTVVCPLQMPTRFAYHMPLWQNGFQERLMPKFCAVCLDISIRIYSSLAAIHPLKGVGKVTTKSRTQWDTTTMRPHLVGEGGVVMVDDTALRFQRCPVPRQGRPLLRQPRDQPLGRRGTQPLGLIFMNFSIVVIFYHFNF